MTDISQVKNYVDKLLWERMRSSNSIISITGGLKIASKYQLTLFDLWQDEIINSGYEYLIQTQVCRFSLEYITIGKEFCVEVGFKLQRKPNGTSLRRTGYWPNPQMHDFHLSEIYDVLGKDTSLELKLPEMFGFPNIVTRLPYYACAEAMRNAENIANRLAIAGFRVGGDVVTLYTSPISPYEGL